jgi:hypothetical protein
MSEETGLLQTGLGVVQRNLRYVIWFWLLNLALAWFGTLSYRGQIQPILGNSLHADQLLHGFNPATYRELLAMPQSGSMGALTTPSYFLAGLFAVTTFLLMPGVLRQYTSEYRVSRDEFFRTCGRNLWRYVRLVLLYGVIAVPLIGILFGIRSALQDAAEKALNEMLPFWVGTAMLAVIFVAATTMRIWFDLAEVDVVVRDQNAVRKSVGAGFRYMRRYWGRLIGAYVGISILALIVLIGGIWLWHILVPPSSVLGALVIGQIMMLLWLGARFWQRAVAAVFYMREMLVVPSYAGFRGPETGPASVPGASPIPTPS